MKSTITKAATKQANLDQVVNLIAIPDDGKLMAIEDRRTTPAVEVQVQKRPNAKQLTAATNKAVKSAKNIREDVAAQLAAAAKNKPEALQALITEINKQVDGDTKAELVQGYNGPMRALRDRVKAGKYTKAANGQPSCGDEVAQVLGALEPTEVIKACMIAMDITNPYLNLNIGQQSMNLRNKLRGQLKRGEIGMGVLREAVEVVMEARPAAPTRIKLTSATGIDDASEQHHTEAAPAPEAKPAKAKGMKRAPKPTK